MNGGQPPKCVRATMTMEFSDGRMVRFDAVEPADAMIDMSPYLPEMDAGLLATLPVIQYRPRRVTLKIVAGIRHPMEVVTRDSEATK